MYVVGYVDRTLRPYASHWPRLSVVWWMTLLATPRIWIARNRQRKALQRLIDDSYLLKDIGVSRADAEWEAEKPFWRP
jgi:uncharacterized protein YjiS (DUF1127 family)